MTDSNDKAKEEITLSKRMFFAGCLGLPWLWICNALYFRLQVFGPLVMVDYWPGKSPPPSSSDNNEGSDDDGNSNSDEQQQQQTMDQELERQIEKQELKKWVTRSTRGAFLVMTLFVAWIITFQVNKENFGSKWFVMDPTDEEVSGW
mmetsp:Transcript_18865/g.40818  ORF Transcript_18865/g.40818 Transcript_18865/m.40818 type:complete len:147 (-) Transcript_18865:129-569(-)|eukprot:CAMPEP_0172314470 /NCGR_PEP_ID=MMETSP1058-20130122/22623_1 /TAXON_ID=83371 /ORGANISM="Detonula confervacea, Strain CCMP 353" /LENGTH=146 /DNA_ID=CAMNT_0013028351 /DNA_START=166 /DNA_END=606 /DNA_ORIENTATION=+